MPCDLDPCLLCDGRRERSQRTRQPKILERLRSQPAHDAPHLLRALPGGLAELVELLAVSLGNGAGEALHLKHDSRERLADLVVQLTRDPLALAFLDE